MRIIYAVLFLVSYIHSIPAHSLQLDFIREHVQPNTLLIKTTDSLGLAGAYDLQDSFSISEVSYHIQSVEPAFSPQDMEGMDFPGDQYFIVKLEPGTSLTHSMISLDAFDSIERIEPNYHLSDPDFVMPKDPKIKDQWYLDRLQVKDAWKVSRGENTWVADVESGWDTEHPDLKNQFDLEKSYDYDPKTKDPKNVNDNKRSHGTPVMGIIGAEAGNNLFGVGIAHKAKLIGSQMADSWAAHTTEKVWTVNTAKAILGSVKRGASVVLIEKQLPSTKSSVERSAVIYDAIKAAVDKGIPVIVPAGNFGTELKKEAEQEDTGSIFVGATTRTDKRAWFSDYGERVDVSAPGEQVYSIQENKGEEKAFGGTSSASAITAGIVALVRSVNPKLSPREIRKLLKETGKVVSEETATKKIGPLLQASDALDRALDL